MHNRHSIRLKGYDYSCNGAYFVTIVCQNREDRFGEIINGEMKLNDAGRMVVSVWNDFPGQYPGICIGSHIVMPNHFHGIIVLNHDVGAGPRARPEITKKMANEMTDPKTGQPQGGAPTGNLSLADVMHRFKSFTTHRYSNGVKLGLVPPFDKRLWQRNYYEHIIRNEHEYDLIRDYINNNPQSWENDRFGIRNNLLQEERAMYGNGWSTVC